jgi:hypothetical protein
MNVDFMGVQTTVKLLVRKRCLKSKKVDITHAVVVIGSVLLSSLVKHSCIIFCMFVKL